MRTTRATVLVAAAMLTVACGTADVSTTTTETSTTSPEAATVRLITHDSFAVSDGVWDAFTEATGHTVEVFQGTDAGSLTNQIVLTADDPVADVVFGVDTTFVSRALEADVFSPYASPGLERVADGLEIDDRVTPITVGDVCINYDTTWFDDDLPPPADLASLADPAYRGLTVVMNPATSSPGLAFLLATVAEFGDDGWETYWSDLVDNDLRVTTGWSEAYYGDFSVAGGDRPIVVSYATSPPVELVFAEEPMVAPVSAVLTTACFRQVEYAGILQPSPAAEALIDFMLSPTFQNDIPLTMFVYPVADDAVLPDVFVEHGEQPEAPFELDPASIEEHRDEWIDRWTDIVLP